MQKFIEIKNSASSLHETINVSDIIKFEPDFHEKTQTILHLRDTKNSYFQIEEPYEQFKSRIQSLLTGNSALDQLDKDL